MAALTIKATSSLDQVSQFTAGSTCKPSALEQSAKVMPDDLLWWARALKAAREADLAASPKAG
jgi:hypothetical protein